MKKLTLALFFVLALPCLGLAGVGLDLAASLGDWNITYSNIDHPMADGWQERFVPQNEGLDTSPRRTFLRMDLAEIGIAPTISLGALRSLRFPVTYTPLRGLGLGHEHVHENVVSWWDQVVGNAVDLRPTLPTFGLQYISNGVGLGYSLTRYRFTNQEFVGDDCWGCRNGSHVISSEPYGYAWGHRVSLVVYHVMEGGNLRKREGAEFYYEYQGKGVHRVGVKLIYGFVIH